jgi:hypothetical protein
MRKPSKLPGVSQPAPLHRSLTAVNYAVAAAIVALSLALQLGWLDGLILRAIRSLA